MRTLIRNATILPMTEPCLSFRGDILIEDKRIKKIGTVNEDSDEIIDASDMIALPAFVNSHTHVGMSLLRNYGDRSGSVSEWLSKIWPIEDELNASDILAASRLSIAELIKSGCTTFADMYFHQEQTIAAVIDAGISASISLVLFGGIEETEKRIREVLPGLDEAASGYERIRIDTAVHSIYTCSSSTYIAATELTDNRKTVLHTHLSENISEVKESIEKNGMEPAEYLDSLGVFSVPAILAHSVHYSDSEIEILKKHRDKAFLVNCPASNLKLDSGIADFAKYRESGLRTALGTDGAASNNNLSMIKEINLAALLMKPSATRAYDAIEMATIGGAEALRMDNEIGTIEEGKLADIVLINTDSENMTPSGDPFSAVAFSSDRGNIDTVFSSGKKLLDKGEIIYADPDEIRFEANRAQKRIFGG